MKTVVTLQGMDKQLDYLCYFLLLEALPKTIVLEVRIKLVVVFGFG